MGRNRARLSVKPALLAALSFLLAAAAMAWVLRSFDLASFLRLAANLDWRWIEAAVFFDVLSYLTQGYRWQRLLEPLVRLSPWRTTRAVYAGLFVNEVAPLRPGEALRAFLIARESGAGLGGILPSMVAERLMDGLCLAAAVAVAAAFAPLPPGAGRFLAAAGTLGAAVVAGLLLARRRIPEAWLAPLRNRAALGLSLAALLIQGLAMWAALRGCRLPLSAAAGMTVMLAVRLGTLLPGAPANIGAHQFSTMFGLGLFGVAPAAAASAAFVVFATLTIPLWVIGMFALGASGLTLGAARRLPRLAAAAAAA